MKVGVQYKGFDKLEQKLAKLGKSGDLAVFTRMIEYGTKIHEVARKSIQNRSESTGAVWRYAKGGKRRRAYPSKPGAPPNTDTGALVRSIKLRVVPAKLLVQVGTNIVYGKALELGAKVGKKRGGILAPRPWLMPAVKQVLQKPPRVSEKIKETLIGGVKR